MFATLLLAQSPGQSSLIAADEKVPDAGAPESGPSILFSENFDSIETGELPDSFLIMEGEWTVVADPSTQSSACARLPGTPLDQFGFMFGDYLDPGHAVRASVLATRKGRVYPSFGVGALGLGGFQLRVSPGRRTAEILQDGEVKASAPFRWEGSGKWTTAEILVHPESPAGQWKVQARVWDASQPPPEEFLIEFIASEEPFSGQASVWATPYSGTPVHVDNIEIRSLMSPRVAE